MTWGFFIYGAAASGIAVLSPEFNRAATSAFATTIYIALLAILAVSVIGLVLVGIINLIDILLTAAL